MHTFTDRAGRGWALDINVGAVKRVKVLVGFDLLDIGEGRSLERLSGDPVLLCDVLYCLVKPQAEALGVSDEQFGAALAGDALGDAADALLAELVAFFPKGQRELLSKTLARSREIEARLRTLAAERIDDPAILARIETELATGGALSAGRSSSADSASPTPTA